MYEYWLIYTEKGEFKGFKAMGFGDANSMKEFVELFKEHYIFIDTSKSFK